MNLPYSSAVTITLFFVCLSAVVSSLWVFSVGDYHRRPSTLMAYNATVSFLHSLWLCFEALQISAKSLEAIEIMYTTHASNIGPSLLFPETLCLILTVTW